MIFRMFSDDPSAAIMVVMVVMFSICLHEYFHARAALWQGDDTAARLGHLTLNPLKQMGIFSLIMLLFIGLAFGRVPVDRSKLKKPWGEAIVSFAGPFANMLLFIISIIGATIAIFMQTEPQYSPMFDMFFMGAKLNFVLFIFNMAPFPPLDGYGILSAFFPKLRNQSSEFLNGATFFIFMILFVSAEYLFVFAHYISLMGIELSVNTFIPLVQYFQK